MLIAIEGLDASGKTTQTHLLVEKLKSKGFDVHTLDFPQYENNVFGRILKKFLANEYGDSVNFDPRLSALLFAGDRYESIQKLKEWTSKNNDSVVVLNRYVPSNLAYNRAKLSDPSEIEEMSNFIETLEYDLLKLPQPDLVIVLGSSSAITQARLRTEDDRDGYENDANFLDRVADEYIKLQQKHYAWELVPIEGDESRESVHQKVWDVVQNYTTNTTNTTK